MTSNAPYELLSVHVRSDRALMWPGKIIAVFSHPPMKYVLVYDRIDGVIAPDEWPKSLDEATARSLIPTLTRALASVDN